MSPERRGNVCLAVLKWTKKFYLLKETFQCKVWNHSTHNASATPSYFKILINISYNSYCTRNYNTSFHHHYFCYFTCVFIAINSMNIYCITVWWFLCVFYSASFIKNRIKRKFLFTFRRHIVCRTIYSYVNCFPKKLLIWRARNICHGELTQLVSKKWELKLWITCN